MGNGVFYQCAALSTAYFKGDEPVFVNSNPFDGPIFPSSFTTLYYLPGSTGWGPTYGGEPTQVWIPQIQTSNGDFGIQGNPFGFDINWASGTTVVVEACADLLNPVWLPIQTILMTSSTVRFTDLQWTTYPSRCYRVRSQ